MSGSPSPSAAPFCLVKSSINIDETFAVPHIVRPGETLSSSGLTSRPGGKGANVSAAIALAGASVRLSGAVGTDAPWPLDELASRGVDVRAVQTLPSHPTGRAFIQIAADGENSIVLLKGANFALETEANDPGGVFAATPRRVTHLVVQNEIPIAVTVAFLRHAGKRRGEERVTSVFNPSPMPSREELQAFPWETVDVLIVNEGEGSELLEALHPNGSEALHPSHEPGSDQRAREVVDLLASLPSLAHTAWIVLTRGSRGVLARILVANQPDRTLLDIPPVKPSQVKDTTGAGDTFAGNLVAALMGYNIAPETATPRSEGHDERPRIQEAAARSEQQAREVLGWACKAASVACESEGAMRSIPKAEENQEMLDLID